MSNRPTFYSLQLFRFVAALQVLLFHLGTSPSGYKGVDIFFTISGFVLYHSLFSANRPKPYRYLVNRLTKIFFLYWVALALYSALRPQPLSPEWLGTILLVPGHLPVLGVSWSLSYELYFYFLLGLIAYCLPEKFHKKVFVLLLVSSGLVTLLIYGGISVRGSLIRFCWALTCGSSCSV